MTPATVLQGPAGGGLPLPPLAISPMSSAAAYGGPTTSSTATGPMSLRAPLPDSGLAQIVRQVAPLLILGAVAWLILEA